MNYQLTSCVEVDMKVVRGEIPIELRNHHHPEDLPSDDKEDDEYSEKRLYFCSVFGFSAISLTLMLSALTAPSWFSASQHSVAAVDFSLAAANKTQALSYVGSITNLSQPLVIYLPNGAGLLASLNVRLWGECACYDTLDEPCDSVRRLFEGGRAMSLAALGCECIMAVCYTCVYAGFLRRFHHTLGAVAVVLGYVGSATLFVSFVAFAVAFDDAFCGEVVALRGGISWSFATRVAEFVFMVVETSLATFQARHATKRLSKTLLFGACVCCGLTCLTTAAQNWVQEPRDGFELGLWRGCVCAKSPCREEDSIFRLQQAMCVMAVVVLVAHISSYFLHLPKYLLISALIFAEVCMGIAFTTSLSWFHQSYCGRSSAYDRGYRLNGPGFLVLLSLLLTGTSLVLTVLRAKMII